MPIEAIQFFALVGTTVIASCGGVLWLCVDAMRSDFEIEE